MSRGQFTLENGLTVVDVLVGGPFTAGMTFNGGISGGRCFPPTWSVPATIMQGHIGTSKVFLKPPSWPWIFGQLAGTLGVDFKDHQREGAAVWGARGCPLFQHTHTHTRKKRKNKKTKRSLRLPALQLGDAGQVVGPQLKRSVMGLCQEPTSVVVLLFSLSTKLKRAHQKPTHAIGVRKLEEGTFSWACVSTFVQLRPRPHANLSG